MYNGYLFQRSREQESYQNQPGAYSPYPFYLTSNPRIPYQYVPQEAPRSCSPISSSQADLSGEKGVTEKSRRTSWEHAETRSLIAAYRENYNRLKSTKSSHGKKSVRDSIMADFVSFCCDAGIESEKTLAQIKEKWQKRRKREQALMEKRQKVPF